MNQFDLRPEDLLHDDENLLADRLLRSLHRNKDGHLATAYNRHKMAVQDRHNVAILYLYTVEQDAYTLLQHYLHSPDPKKYGGWHAAVIEEGVYLTRNSGKNFYGVYGWLTAHVQITPLRTGDLLIKIDKEGARGVRLSFGSGKDKREAHTKTQSARRTRKRNRL